MNIEGNFKEELTTIETMTIKQLAQTPSIIKIKREYSFDVEIKKIVGVEPLNDKYVAVKFLTWVEKRYRL